MLPMNISAPNALETSASHHRSPIDLASAHSAVGARVAQQQAALLEIMRSGMLERELPEILTNLTEVTARTIDVGRVSVWRLNSAGDSIEMVDLFAAATGNHASGTKLQAERYPAYFEALRTNRVISAPDVERDPRVIELREDYLQPQHIQSMLDSAIWHAGQSRGVVCVESVAARREWTFDEQQFVGSIADLVALAIENETRRDAQSRASDSEHRFSQVFRLIPDWLVVTRIADGVVLEVNHSFQDQTGYRADEVVGKTTRNFGMWADSGQREQWLARIEHDGQVQALEADLRLKSGDIRNFQISTEPIVFRGENCLVSAVRDITENKRHSRMVFEIAQGVASGTGESFFRSLVERLALALDADVAFIGEIDRDDSSQVHANAVQGRDGPAKPFAYPLEGSPCEVILRQGVCAYPRDVARMFPRDRILAEQGIEAYVGAPLHDSTGRPRGVIAVMFSKPLEERELAIQLMRIFASRASVELERRDQLIALEHRATHDALTNLQNRTSLEKKIETAIAGGGAGSRGALLLLDLDRFKEINDTLGHAVGDRLLIKIADRLKADNARGNICHGEVARLGGDEFAIWLGNIADASVARAIASRALATVNTPFEIDGSRLQVETSIGIAVYPEHGSSASDLLRCADIAMYAAKRKGTGYSIYESSEDPYSAKRLTLMSQLGDAVRGNELELHYQPRISFAQGKRTGFEALVRWRHPQLGLLPPGQFIPLAELSDVIRPLTMWVIEEALAQIGRWHQRGWDVFVSVNASARHLMDDSFPLELKRLLDKHRIDPAQLELEITESAIIVDPARATQILKRVHEMGVRISIDDFGTGFSSLSHLQRLPIHALKIDVSFVTHMLINEQDAVIVESTINLAHNLGLSVVAEGIEDAATHLRLRALGCDEGQGYFFARPMDEDAASAWLEKQTA